MKKVHEYGLPTLEERLIQHFVENPPKQNLGQMSAYLANALSKRLNWDADKTIEFEKTLNYYGNLNR